MNGQQLTNSSNSANGTPTSPSSSYPASLSSQSSRDPSPASRVNNALPAQIDRKHFPESPRNYSQNHWHRDHVKAGGHGVNNFSSHIMSRINPLLSNLPSEQSSNFVMPNSQMPLNQTSVSDGKVPNTGHSDSNIRSTATSGTQNFTSNIVKNTHNILQNDLNVMNDLRRSPLPISATSGAVRTNVQGTLPSTLKSESRQETADSLSADSSSNQIQNNRISDLGSNLNPKNSVPPVQRSSQPQSIGSTSVQSQFPSQNLNNYKTPVSVTSNQFQKPVNSASHSFQPPYTQSSVISQPPTSQTNSVTQSQFHSMSSYTNTQNQFQPTISQPNPVSHNQLQHPTSQFNPINHNQFQPPISQSSSSSSQNMAQPLAAGLNSQNQHYVNNLQTIPVSFQSQPSTIETTQYQQPPNKSHLGQPSRPVLAQNTQFQQSIKPQSAMPNSFHNSTVPPKMYPQTIRPSYPNPQVNQQSTMGQHPINQIQQSQPYNLPPTQEIQGLNNFQHLSLSNQNVGQYPLNKRYPQMAGYGGSGNMGVDSLSQNLIGMSVQSGFNKLWGMDSIDLLKTRDILPKDKCEAPPIRLQHELYEAANCSPEIFRCTLTKIPETKSLLDKSRLPLGVLIHPFKDLNQLSVIQCTVIVRCRVCRTYINPFVYFVDNKRWKCNLCFRVNELPDEFQFDPMTKTYGDPSRRPEIKSATIEFIAPSEYMVRPPQPAIYVFLLDVSRLAADCGYLEVVCRILMEELDNLPGDARTSVAFITYDSSVHFYSLTEGLARPHQMIVVDIDDMFLPCPENLLVNLNECHELIRDLLSDLPNKYKESYDTGSALGAALQAAYKLLAPTGGRISVFQACLPNLGPGALSPREDPAQRASENVSHLNPMTDFYKKLALDCSGQQIAVDLFLVNSQYVDLATLSGISKFSGGCIHHFPLFRSDKPFLVQNLEKIFQRYLTRKIGFESVMRLRCTRGLSIHTFHGNFFVRSTDLLSLPNANPDSGFGMQVSIDENLSDIQTVCFQAALLYTSSKGERRIRVHTLCLPIASTLSDILHGADQNCIIGLLAKMAVDRSVQSSLSDAREAFLNVAADVLSAYKLTQSVNTTGCVLASGSLRLLPLYILSLLKYMAFRIGQSTRLDDRVFAMCQMKTMPLCYLLQVIYPDLYAVHDLDHQIEVNVGDQTIPQPPRLHLSAERLDSTGVFLMDDSTNITIYVGHNLHPSTCLALFNVSHFAALPQEMYELPDLDNPESERLRTFVNYLQNEKPFHVPIQIIRDDSPYRMRFIERLVEDKTEAGPSYYEFLQRVKALIK